MYFFPLLNLCLKSGLWKKSQQFHFAIRSVVMGCCSRSAFHPWSMIACMYRVGRSPLHYLVVQYGQGQQQGRAFKWQRWYRKLDEQLHLAEDTLSVTCASEYPVCFGIPMEQGEGLSLPGGDLGWLQGFNDLTGPTRKLKEEHVHLFFHSIFPWDYTTPSPLGGYFICVLYKQDYKAKKQGWKLLNAFKQICEQPLIRW